MAKNEISDYDETDSGNTDISGITLSDATLIDALDNIARAQMGALKRWFKSSLFRLRDSTDQTKLLAVDLSGFTTATTRTLAVQDKNGTIALTQNTGPGQCYLTLDGTNLRLSPFNGNILVIGGEAYAIPDAGVALSSSGASSSTTYYIYAYMNSGTMTLEFSTTGYAEDGGIKVKSGDTSRTLVGMARTTSGGAWVNSAREAFVISWFNRKKRRTTASLTATRTVTSATPVAVNVELTNYMLVWADEPTITISAYGQWASDTAAVGRLSAVLDGAGTAETRIDWLTALLNSYMPFAITRNDVAAGEGRRLVELYGRSASGTLTFDGGAGEPCTLTCEFRG